MNMLAQIALFLWIPIVAIFFLSMPHRRAVSLAFVAGWLILPNSGFAIPGFPNYTKMTATMLAVFLCTLIFDFSRFTSFRPRWYDLPIVVWCIEPFFSALSNDLGPYEGASAILEQVVSWGIPYYFGRIYLTDLASVRELAMAMVIGGILYIPLCLLEMRLSPILSGTIYGIGQWEATRFNGYRPRVFLSTGLELGMWMANATLLGYLLWSSSSVKVLRGVSFGMLMLGLTITTVLCRSTGALVLLLAGVSAFVATRMSKKSWIIGMLLLIPPTYALTRTLNLWSGQEVIEITKSTVGADRAESFEYRLIMERMLADHALARPILGWGRHGRNMVHNGEGRLLTVPDGFWIITLGSNGMLGLATLLTMMLLPMVLTLRRFPVTSWMDPQIAPLAGMSMVLVLMMIDFLSNAMLNPVYALAMGAISGQSAIQPSSGSEEAEARVEFASDLMGEGRTAEAVGEFRRAIHLVEQGDDINGRQLQARALDGLGHSLAGLGRLDESEEAFRDALMIRDWLTEHVPDAGRFRDLAIARESLARLLADAGRPIEAVAERQIALKIWDALVTDHPRNAEYRAHRVEALNDLSWLLSTDPDPALRKPSLALDLAEEAIRSSSDGAASCWNTLGVARYRAGDWPGAIEALEHSAVSSDGGQGTSFDHYFLAMAWGRLQNEGQAHEWFERGLAWSARNRPGHPTLERFREEAESLLQSETGPSTALKKI